MRQTNPINAASPRLQARAVRMRDQYTRAQRRFEDLHGLALDVRSLAYANLWLRDPRVTLPMPDVRAWFREPGLWLPLSCAIAFDSQVDLGNDFAGNSADFVVAFNNVAGDDAFVMINAQNTADLVAGVLYNGVTLNKIGAIGEAGNNLFAHLYNLKSPATGSHNVTIQKSGNLILSACAASYSGSDTSGTSAGALDVTGTGHLAGSSSNSFSKTLTTTVTTRTIAGFGAVAALTADGSPATRRTGTNGDKGLILDSNADVAAGSNTLGVTSSGFPAYAGVMCGLKPAGGSGGGVTFPQLERFIRGLERGVVQ